MTWSIVAREPESEAFGIAISTKALAVGAMCPFISFGYGALSSQSYSSPVAGERAIQGMEKGQDVEASILAALSDDEGRDWRQIHGVDASGRSFAYTGASCVDWCGHWTGESVSIAGNMLAGAPVVEACAESWQKNPQLKFTERLLQALVAGQEAGGDKRGRQSGALLVKGDEAHSLCDLRVDDHPDPVKELCRLFNVFKEQRMPYMQTVPTRRNPSGVFDLDEREAMAQAYRDSVSSV